MDLRNKKDLVTGADGFIGSYLTEELSEARQIDKFIEGNFFK
jgi:nucleoside-diphosphate-sugar epimerase